MKQILDNLIAMHDSAREEYGMSKIIALGLDDYKALQAVKDSWALLDETLGAAEKAVEKRIPKKPKNIIDYFVPETYDYDYSTADCPCCGAGFTVDGYYQTKYCSECGQAILWESE